MAPHESLPDGQRAILQLLLKQGKSYVDLAGMLKSDPAAIRRRAHDAVEALGPEGQDISVDRRQDVADYLLGQQSASRRAATREYLEESSAGRAWARAAAGALRPLGGTLPDVPAEPAEIEQAFDALDRRTARRDEVQRGSRTGGRLLFAGLGLLLAIGLLWAFGAFDGTKKENAQAPTTSTATTEGPQQYEPLLTAGMKPAKGTSSKSQGLAVIARKAGTQELSLALQGLDLPASPRRGSAYATWLYSSASNAKFIGFTPLVGKDGLLEGAFELDKATPRFKQVLVTRETREQPSRPGTIVLRGPLKAVSVKSRQRTQPQG